jgi:hypothetical protein
MVVLEKDKQRKGRVFVFALDDRESQVVVTEKKKMSKGEANRDSTVAVAVQADPRTSHPIRSPVACWIGGPTASFVGYVPGIR